MLSPNLTGDIKILQKVKFTRITRIKTFLEGGNFLGVQIRGGNIFRPTKMLVFAMVIVFLTFLGLGIKFSRWGKNSLGGVKNHQVGTSETVRYVRSSS